MRITLPITVSLGWLGHVTLELADADFTCPPSSVTPTVDPRQSPRGVQIQPLCPAPSLPILPPHFPSPHCSLSPSLAALINFLVKGAIKLQSLIKNNNENAYCPLACA